MIVRAISLKQPWANLIASGKKTIETRTWTTHYRGPVLIVASKAKIRDKRGKVIEPMGCSVAVAVITDCRPMRAADRRAACLPLVPGKKAWILKNIRGVPQVPIHGRLGIYRVRIPPALARHCRIQS